MGRPQLPRVAGATDAGLAGLLQVSAQEVKSEVPVRCPRAHVQQAGQDFRRWRGGISRGLTSLKLVVNAREDMSSVKKGVRMSQEGGGVRSSSSGLVEGLFRGAWRKQSGEARGSHAMREWVPEALRGRGRPPVSAHLGDHPGGGRLCTSLQSGRRTR